MSQTDAPVYSVGVADPAISTTAEPTESPQPGRWARMMHFLRRLGPAGPLAVVAAVLPPIGALALLGIVSTFAPRLRDSSAAPFVCLAAFAVLGGLSILPTYALSILAGWSFGFAVGFPTAWAGIVGASLVGYAAAQRATGSRLVGIIDEKPAWRAVHRAMLGGGFWHAVWIIFLLRSAPFPPFALTNFACGAAHVRLSRYVTGTVFGMAPHAAILAFTAAGLHDLSFRGAGEPWLIALSALALVAVSITIGRLAKRTLDALPPATIVGTASPSDHPPHGGAAIS